MAALNPYLADPNSNAFQQAYCIIAEAVGQVKVILPLLKPNNDDIASFADHLLLHAPKYQENPVALFQSHCKELSAYKNMNEEAILAMAEKHADFTAYRIRDVVEELSTEKKLMSKSAVFSSVLSDAVMKEIQDQRIAVYMERFFQRLNESPLLIKIFSDAENECVENFAKLNSYERIGSYLFAMQSMEFELLNQRTPDELPLRSNPWTVRVALAVMGAAIIALGL